jgi:hypothetical protein
MATVVLVVIFYVLLTVPAVPALAADKFAIKDDGGQHEKIFVTIDGFTFCPNDYLAMTNDGRNEVLSIQNSRFGGRYVVSRLGDKQTLKGTPSITDWADFAIRQVEQNTVTVPGMLMAFAVLLFIVGAIFMLLTALNNRSGRKQKN